METVSFRSTFGWTMDIPGSWRLLGETRSNVIFVDQQSDKLHFSWTFTQVPIEKPVAEKFIQLTMRPTQVPPTEARATMGTIFAPAGEITAARVIEKLDGVRALEVEERFGDKDGPSRGYQFIFQSALSPFSTPAFERIAFFCDEKNFETRIDGLKSAVETFTYI